MTAAIAKIVWLVGLVAWYAIRHRHWRRAQRLAVVRHRRGPLERTLLSIATIGLFVVPVVWVATGFPAVADRPFRPSIAWLGTAVFVLFLWVFHVSHRDLGRNWSATLEIRESHTLVTGGIYRHVRHPMYVSFWLWALAQALLLPNWLVGFAGLLAIGTFYFCRVTREERLMLETFGDEYRAYARKTARLIPWIY